MVNVREELDRLIIQGGYGYASISRLLGRNPSYIQQFIKRGSPKILDDDDRKTLACFFGVDEQTLGGPASPVSDGMVEIPVLEVEASAGFGAIAESESAQTRFVFGVAGRTACSDPHTRLAAKSNSADRCFADVSSDCDS